MMLDHFKNQKDHDHSDYESYDFLAILDHDTN